MSAYSEFSELPQETRPDHSGARESEAFPDHAASSASDGKPFLKASSVPSSLSPSFPPRAGVHGEGAARAVAALALLPPALGFSVWLTLCCADFLPLERASYEAASAWLLFALHVGMGCLLPPALIGGFTRLLPREKDPVSPLLLLRESARAALLSYALFVTLFFLAAWLLQRFLPAFHPMYVPALLSRIQALVCCLLLWISWSIAVFLLPPATRHTTPPPGVRLFFVLAWILALLGLFASPLSPYADGSGTPGGTFGHPLDFFLLAASSWLLFRHGLRSMRVIFIALCAAGPLAGLAWLPPDLPPADAAFALSRAILALAACICLWLPSSRAWLVE